MPTPRLFGLSEPSPIPATQGPSGESSQAPAKHWLIHGLAARLLSRPGWDLHESAAWGNSPIDIYVKRELD